MDEKTGRIVKDFAADLNSQLGDLTASLILYGSAVAGEYVPGRSDLNFLLVLKTVAAEKLTVLIKPLARWRRKGVGLPMILTREEILNSLDAFPMEFLEMKSAYRVIQGEDVLAGILIGPENLRLECEREVKGKLIQLRRGYLELGDRRRERDRLFRESIKAFLAIMRSMLWLSRRESVQKGQDVIEAMERELGAGLPHCRKVLEFRAGAPRLAATEAHRLYAGYLAEVGKLSEWINAFAAKPGPGKAE